MSIPYAIFAYFAPGPNNDLGEMYESITGKTLGKCKHCRTLRHPDSDEYCPWHAQTHAKSYFLSLNDDAGKRDEDAMNELRYWDSVMAFIQAPKAEEESAWSFMEMRRDEAGY